MSPMTADRPTVDEVAYVIDHATPEIAKELEAFDHAGRAQESAQRLLEQSPLANVWRADGVPYCVSGMIVTDGDTVDMWMFYTPQAKRHLAGIVLKVRHCIKRMKLLGIHRFEARTVMNAMSERWHKAFGMEFECTYTANGHELALYAHQES